RSTRDRRCFCRSSSVASPTQIKEIIRRPAYQPAVNSPKHSLEPSQVGVTTLRTTRHEPAARRKASVHFSPHRIESRSPKMSSNPCCRSHSSSLDANPSSREAWEKKIVAISGGPIRVIRHKKSSTAPGRKQRPRCSTLLGPEFFGCATWWATHEILRRKRRPA